MNPFFKALIGIVLVAGLAVLGIYAQYWSTVLADPIELTRSELDLFAEANLQFRDKTQMANDPAARKKFLERLGKQLALASEAQRRGLGDTDEVKVIEELGTAQVLQDAYSKKHPELAAGQRGVQADPAEVDAWVAQNGADIARYQTVLKKQGQGMAAPDPKQIGSVFVIARKARDEGLQRDPETALQIKLNKYGALIQALLPQLEEETQYSDDEIKQYYAEKSATGELDEVHAQHILFSTSPMPSPEDPFGGGGAAPDKEAKRKQAEEVLARIRNGEDFGELAKQFSDDPGSKEKGGDMGFSPRFKFVPEFEEAAWKLQPGQVSDIVETDFGFHIIKVLERRPPPELTAELQAQLKEQLSQRRFEEKVDEISRRSAVVLPDDFTVTAPPPPQFPQGVPMQPGGAVEELPEDDGHGHGAAPRPPAAKPPGHP